ncbi:Uncharacterized protein GBIM_09103 [Gryllus bimaculatus]|nr:Uncharacterized protein GBIM_09103 [Gryllus bimaculatus]
MLRGGNGAVRSRKAYAKHKREARRLSEGNVRRVMGEAQTRGGAHDEAAFRLKDDIRTLLFELLPQALGSRLCTRPLCTCTHDFRLACRINCSPLELSANYGASAARRVEGVAALRRALAALGGASASARGAAFLAVLAASQTAPRRRSAVLLFTGRPSADESYGALASQELVNRGCRKNSQATKNRRDRARAVPCSQLFVWWSGARRYGSSAGAERLYRDAVQHTGGGFFDAERRRPSPPGDGGDYQPLVGDSQEYMQVILAAREGLHGSSRTEVLVDSTVEELTIIILGYVSQASLHPPSGEVIDLLVVHGGAAAEAAGDGVLERRLNTRGERPGRWQLTTSDGSGSTGADAAGAANPADDGYDVIVKGTSGLRVGLQRPGRPATEDTALASSGDLVVTIHGGPRTNVTGLVLLDHKGNELRKTFYKQRTRRDQHNREVIELSLPQTALEPEQQLVPHYVQVNGYNGYNGGSGEAFTRITPQIPTTGSLIVTLNAASNLTIQPGTQSQVFLDITNNGSRPSRIYVQGVSSRNIIYRVTPTNFQLNPNQRRSVSFHLYAPPNLVGVGETLKIQVYGDLTVSELFLEINIADSIYEARDTNRPSLKHKILNDCREIQSCSSRQWTMEATVQDQDSGIREISSVPHGVIWTPMVIGTKLPTTLKYKASCCEESVVITVTDLQNNHARYTVNVNDESTGLSPGVIAGIVVGALIILIIIIVIIVVVCKKNRTTHTFQTQQVAR